MFVSKEEALNKDGSLKAGYKKGRNGVFYKTSKKTGTKKKAIKSKVDNGLRYPDFKVPNARYA